MRLSAASSESVSSRLWLRRRDFLLWGSACAVTAGLGLETAEAAVKPAQLSPLPIGFVRDSERFRRFRRSAWRRAVRTRVQSVPARSLTLGDQRLAGETIRLGIHGLYPRVPKSPNLRGADLDILFPSPDPAFPAPLRFHAWSYRPNNSSPPLSCVVPLGLDGRLDLEMSIHTDQASYRYGASFTVDWDSRRPKLQQGVYLLGLTSAWDSAVTLPLPGEKVPTELLAIAASVEPLPAE